MTQTEQTPTNKTSEFHLALFIILMIVLIGVVMLFVKNVIYTTYIDKDVSIGNLTIKGSQLDSIIDAVPDGKFKICHIDTNECVILKKEKIE